MVPRYLAAAANPTTCDVIGVPASNRCGGGAYVVASIVTVSIIDPPVMNGGISFSSSRRPYSTPIPLGPSILWPENAA
jgi:hypothetical protein